MVNTPRKGSPLAFLAVVVIVCGLLGGVGFFVGRATVLFPLRSKLGQFREGTSLATHIGDDRDSVAAAFYDPAAASQGMDDYAWTIPNVMTPFVGHAPEPGKSGNAQINRWQVRSSKNIQTPKPPDVVRIFATGASVLFSSGAPSQDRTICAYLERKLNAALSARTGKRYEVFAMANPAWGSTHERIAIENRILELEPDLVLSLSGAADIIFGRRGHNIMWYRSFVDQLYFDVMNDVLEVAGHEPMLDVVWVDSVPIAPDLVAERLERNVRFSTHALGLSKTPYVFFLQPATQVTKGELAESESGNRLETAEQWDENVAYYRACSAKIRDRLAALELQDFWFSDLTPIFDEKTAAEPVFLDSFHLGDRGNEEVADAMLSALQVVLLPR